MKDDQGQSLRAAENSQKIMAVLLRCSSIVNGGMVTLRSFIHQKGNEIMNEHIVIQACSICKYSTQPMYKTWFKIGKYICANPKSNKYLKYVKDEELCNFYQPIGSRKGEK